MSKDLRKTECSPSTLPANAAVVTGVSLASDQGNAFCIRVDPKVGVPGHSYRSVLSQTKTCKM